MGRGKKGSTSTRVAGCASAGPSSAAQHSQRAAAAAAALPNPRDPNSDDEDDDEEAAEFRREAAELLKQKQQQTSLPGGLSQKQLDTAVRAFVAQTGISEQQAEDALLSEDALQHRKDFEEWLNQAFMWLAIQSEVQDEAAKLKEAMEVSLREQEAARLAQQTAPPLANLSEERLLKRFQGSAMLHHLSRVLPQAVLFSDRMPVREKVKHKLVELLRLENDCLKWWPGQGTQSYFDGAAERFCQHLRQASSSRGSTSGLLQPAEGAGPWQPQAHDQAAPAAPAAAAAAAGQASKAAVAAAGVGACEGGAGGSCRQSPESEVGSDPGGDGSGDATGAAAAAAGAGAAAAAAQRASKRKRQAPARYRTPSPALSADGTGRKRKQQRTAADDQQPAGRPVSVDCRAAAGRDSSSVPPSVSPSPAPVPAVAGQGTSAAAGQGLAACEADSMQQQDRGTAAQRQQGMLPPLPSPQQQEAPPPPPGPGNAAATAATAPCAAGCDPLQAYQAAADCLSELLQAELATLRHHVYTMPEKACAVPVIFQSAEEQQQEPDCEDSDIELVDVKQPVGALDIPEPAESPAANAPPPPAWSPAAAAAAAAEAAAAAASAPAEAASTPNSWEAAFGGAAAAAQYPGPNAGAAAAAQGLYAPPSPAAAAAGDLAQQFDFMYDPDPFDYKATTDDQGTLFIEID